MVIFELSQSREKLTSHSGLALVGRVLDQTGIRDLVNRVITPSQKGEPKIEHADIVISYMGLLAQGKSDFEAIEEFRADDFFKLALDIEQVPSSSTLRQRLSSLAKLSGDEDLKLRLKQEVARLLGERKVELTPTLAGLSVSHKRKNK